MVVARSCQPHRLAMKVNVSDDEWKHHDYAIYRGALEGFVATAALTIPGFYYLHRKSAWYRSLPFPLRVASVVIVVAPFTSIQAERRSLEFERKQWYVGMFVPPVPLTRSRRIRQVGFRKTRTGSRRGRGRGPVQRTFHY